MADVTVELHNPYLDYLYENYPLDDLYPGPTITFSSYLMYDERQNMFREHEVKKYSWAIPDDEAILKIAGYGPIVEMGAGTGYWAYLLRQLGVDVVAYDQLPPDGTPWPDDNKGSKFANELKISWYHRGHTTWTEVIKGTPRMLRQHSDRALFLCWPPMDNMGYRCLQHYEGDTFIYVGEFDGCTGDKHFFRKLEREWDQVDEYDIPQWAGIHDLLVVYKRKD